MAHLRPHLPNSRLDWLCRAFWLGLIGLHVFPTLTLARDLLNAPTWGTFAESAGLAVALMYFATKVAGVRYVRFHYRWTAVLAFAVICGLVHAEVRRGITPETLPPAVVLVTATALVAASLRIRRLLARVRTLGGRADHLANLLRMRRWSPVLEAALSKHLRLLCVQPAIPRGPPVCC